VLGSSIILGTSIGAGLGGKLMQFGRRRALFIICVAGMVGVLLTLISIKRFYVLLLGRIIFGLCNGVTGATVPRFIEEYLPLEYYTIGVMVFVFSQATGSLISMFDALILPREKDPNYDQLLAENTDWRYIFGFPLLLYFFLLLLFAFAITTEGPKYYIVRDDKVNAMKVINKVYNTQLEDA
jgi:MFS family permease